MSMFSAIGHSTKRLARCCFHWRIQTTCAIRKTCYSSATSCDEGPLRLYNSYLQKQVVKPDDCQLKVVYQLQRLYERLKDYDPRLQSSKFIYWTLLIIFACVIIVLILYPVLGLRSTEGTSLSVSNSLCMNYWYFLQKM